MYSEGRLKRICQWIAVEETRRGACPGEGLGKISSDLAMEAGCLLHIHAEGLSGQLDIHAWCYLLPLSASLPPLQGYLLELSQ